MKVLKFHVGDGSVESSRDALLSKIDCVGGRKLAPHLREKPEHHLEALYRMLSSGEVEIAQDGTVALSQHGFNATLQNVTDLYLFNFPQNAAFAPTKKPVAGNDTSP